ncbi:hypothetical protein Kpol_1049p1 [Vanderwaltozyma polyspora DSM 70294]|uniref:RNA-binding protein VTS1 n=1 Tax=Vanderwaltozyma polyspora (strain ATCC 22028 / DSM 70294 / BCRC 21397 / CBS 2163 / NBRC 10782 / NRRL Y-8283 / UCD 57-17) TaxID=436907 RepID=A7TPP2_VANPO|nr:uncharacterized protein Kpol_1049p1 [Vanderwaltozyma polyspora DSM 70294]EDO15744.1 hypothetical protein Kpol_1049p1 [Vanderwaltozyma polyspora DSM 70294]
MKSGFEDFPTRTQSPFSIGRTAHPGAVFLSSESNLIQPNNQIGSASIMQSSPLPSYGTPLSLNDQNSLLLDNNSTNNNNNNNHQHHHHHHPHHHSNTSNGNSNNNNSHNSISNNNNSNNNNSHNHSSSSAAGSAALLSPTPSSMFLDSFQSPVPQQHPNLSNISHTPMSLSQHQVQHLDPSVMINFNQDITQICSWMSTLSSSLQNTVIDNLLPHFNEDVLQMTRLKLDSLLNSGFTSSPQLTRVSSPIPVSRDTNYPLTSLDFVFAENETNSNLRNHQYSSSMHDSNSSIYRTWGNNQPMMNYLTEFQQRPKSVDPHVIKTLNGGNNNNSHSGIINSNNNNNNNGGNSQFPVSKKQYYQSSHLQSKGMSRGRSVNDYESKISNGQFNQNNTNMHNRQRHNNNNSNINININNNSINGSSDSSISNSTTPTNQTSNGNNPTSSSSSMNPKSLTDPKLLSNIPAWLKSLRLHKYSEALKGKNWVELIYLDDGKLEVLGVTALGARRKLLKAFAIVIDYKERGLIDEASIVIEDTVENK